MSFQVNECQESSINYVMFPDNINQNDTVKIDISALAESEANSPSSRNSTAESDNEKSVEAIPSVSAVPSCTVVDIQQLQKECESTEDQICKICLEKEFEDAQKTDNNQQEGQKNNSEDKFISPCNCKGSIKNIHSMCFFRLLIMRSKNVDGNDIYKCEQCQQIFYLEETAEGVQSKKKKIIFNILFVIALLFSIGILITYILILLNVFYSDSNILCIFLVVAPFIIVILYWQLSTCLPDTMKSDQWKVTAKSEDKCVEYQIDSKNQNILVTVSSFNEKEQPQTSTSTFEQVKQIGNTSVAAVDKSASLNKSSLSNQLLNKIYEEQL